MRPLHRLGGILHAARLTLRKNRLLFRGLAGTFAASLPFAAALGFVGGYGGAQGLQACLLFWSFAGLQLSAALLGAATGAELRSSQARASEDALPVSGRERVLGAALAALGHALFLALLATLVSAALGPAWREAVRSLALSESQPWLDHFSRRGFDLLAANWLRFLPLTLAYVSASSLGLAYGLGQGLVGGLLGLMLGTGGTGALSLGLALQAAPYAQDAYWGWAAAGLLATLLGAPAALARAADWLERGRRGSLAGLAAALLLASGALTSWTGVGLNVRALRGRVFWHPQPAEDTWLRAGSQLSVEARRVRARGILLLRPDGGLDRVLPDGRRTRLLPERGLAGLLRGIWDSSQTLSLAWDTDGTLWILAQRHEPVGGSPGFRYELWHGSPDRPLRLEGGLSVRQPLAERLARVHGRLGVLVLAPSSSGAVGPVAVPVPPGARAPDFPDTAYQFAPVDALDDERRWLRDPVLLNDPVRTVGAEVAWLQGPRLLIQGRDQQGRGGRTWRLPGSARAGAAAGRAGYFPAFPVGREAAFLVPVVLPGGKTALAVCRPDGSVRLEWPGLPPDQDDIGVIPGGGLLLQGGPADALRLADPGGGFLAVPLAPLFERLAQGMAPRIPHIAHAAEGAESVHVVFEGHLVEIAASDGRVLRQWRLPPEDWPRGAKGSPPPALTRPAAEGLFIWTRARLLFMDWEGRLRDLGPAGQI